VNAGIISGSSSVCQGQSEVTYSVPEIDNASAYTWTGTSTTNSITVNYGISAVSGNITVKGNNACGDGIHSSLEIKVNPIPVTPVITLNGNTLHSDAQTGNQWYNQNGVVKGATNQDYTPKSSGNYYVIVTLNDSKSNPSNTIRFTPTGIRQLNFNNRIQLYPNPIFNELVIEIPDYNEEIDFEIINSVGQVVLKGSFKEKTIIRTRDFLSGVYMIKFEVGDSFVQKKIIKK